MPKKSLIINPLQRPPYHRARGFTLLEILIVVVIIGMMLGGIRLAIRANQQDNPNYNAACKLQEKLTFYQEKALFEDQVFGLLMTKEAAVFLALQAQKWQNIETVPWEIFEENTVILPRILNAKSNNINTNININININELTPDVTIEPNNMNENNVIFVFNLPNNPSYPTATTAQDDQGNWQCKTE